MEKKENIIWYCHYLFLNLNVQQMEFLMSLKSIDIASIYNDYIKSQSADKRQEMLEKYPKQGISYRASSSGMCSLKLYYESVMRLEPTEQIEDKVMRVFRLGDLVHTDIQQALVDSVKRKEPKETI